MRRRAFTLIEVAIVLAMTTVLTVSFLDLYLQEYRYFHEITGRADLRFEARGTLYRLLRRGPARIDADNHGLRFADGSAVRWQDTHLLLTVPGRAERSLTTDRVLDFTAVRQSGKLALTLELERSGKRTFRERSEVRR